TFSLESRVYDEPAQPSAFTIPLIAVNENRPGNLPVDPGNPRAVMRRIEAAEKFGHFRGGFSLEVQAKPPILVIIGRLRPDHPADHPWRIPGEFNFVRAHRKISWLAACGIVVVGARRFA